ncbi:MAG: energy transducer TonB [Gemmatimonadales bacterium]|nr:energy transducer TonB [Gemmatimonadales bacterium]MDZ4388783.1 energy transducer TonB [Gemmatimonadales bacterium]
MFENLIESKPKKERTIGEIAMSVVFHALLGIGAIKATQGAAEIVQQKIATQADFVLNEPPPPPPPPPPDEPLQPQTVAVNPPPMGFQTIMPPKDLPTEIPPVNLNEKFDARDFSGKGVEGGIATGIIGGTGPVLTDVVGSESFTIDQVDDPAQYIGGPEPVYPEVMKSVGIEGVVRLRFVVGTDGKVEPNTIQVVSSSNKAFENAAVEGIKKLRFKPARMRGQEVRQLVEQNIRFNLN